MVGRMPLKHLILVRIQAPQQIKFKSPPKRWDKNKIQKGRKIKKQKIKLSKL
tara:strand:+ start:921 stop:1076 length:156 start_codon:yes stop_codon:yes gene_type:complete